MKRDNFSIWKVNIIQVQQPNMFTVINSNIHVAKSPGDSHQTAHLKPPIILTNNKAVLLGKS